MKFRLVALLCATALASCSGGAAPLTPLTPSSTPTPKPTPASGLVGTSFTFAAPKTAAIAARAPQYVTSSIQSVKIVLNSVGGSAPPAGLATITTSNITLSSCPCTVPGPSVPPGSDTFTITTYDAQNGGGNIVSTASAAFTIVPGTTNNNTITLDGMPATLVVSAVPGATAGTAFTSAQPFTVTAKDADGNTIVGTYATPVTLSDSDASGATSIGTSGSDSPPSGELVSSSDAATLNYNGRAIAPATLSASATGATSGTASFSPTLQAIAYSGPLYGGNPEIDLYATSGTGSSGTFTASETGLTGAPYNGGLSISLASGCSSIATATPSSGTSFTVTVASSPSAGSCTLTISDGLGQTQAVTLTYTASAIGVQ